MERQGITPDYRHTPCQEELILKESFKRRFPEHFEVHDIIILRNKMPHCTALFAIFFRRKGFVLNAKVEGFKETIGNLNIPEILDDALISAEENGLSIRSEHVYNQSADWDMALILQKMDDYFYYLQEIGTAGKCILSVDELFSDSYFI